MERLAIIGAGMATAYLLKELADLPEQYHIDVYGDEGRSCYNRILLSSVLCGEKSLNDLDMLDPGQPGSNVKFHQGCTVTSVDPGSKTLITDNNTSHKWNKLVFATGSRAAIPPLPVTQGDGVHAFRNKRDLEAITEAARSADKAVVIGGGLLGLEAATGLCGLGVTTTVVNRAQWIMNRQLDSTAGRLLQAALENKGIRFSLGNSPESISFESSKVTAINFTDGTSLECDMVIFATGITPNKELAANAGITCNKAICIDEYMQTSAEDIFALGECCQWQEHTFGLVAPIQKQAKVLAENLSHHKRRSYTYKEAPVHLKISGVSVVSAGSVTTADELDNQTLLDEVSGVYRRLVFKDERLVGYQLIGENHLGSWYSKLLESESDTSQIRPWMMFSEEHTTPLSSIA